MNVTSFARNLAVDRAVHHFIRRLSIPLAQFSIDEDVPYSVVKSALRAAFVEVAAKRLTKDGQPPTATEIQLLTGIRRQRIRAIQQTDEGAQLEITPMSRILCGWGADARFQNEEGWPADLPLSGVGIATFADLVKTYDAGVTGKVTMDRWLAMAM